MSETEVVTPKSEPDLLIKTEASSLKLSTSQEWEPVSFEDIAKWREGK